MNPLRIVRVIPFFEPARRFGGSVVQGARVARALAARGHRVSVVTSDLGVGPEVPRGTWCVREGYRVFYARAAPWHGVPPYWMPALRRPLEDALADADVLCVNVGLTLANRLASRLARARRVPYVYNAEGALSPHTLRWKRLRKRVFLGLVERPILRGAAALQAFTEQGKRDLVAQGADPARVRVIPNAVDAGEVADAPAGGPERSMAAQRLGLPADARVVLFLGRLSRLKGPEQLLQAFAASARTDRRLRLVLAGPEDDLSRRDLQAAAGALGVGGQVVLPGLLEGEARRSAFRAAEVFALTSLTEGMPISALEACAAGVPVLLSDRCNLPEVTLDGAGRVEAVDPRRLGVALAEMLGDEPVRAEMGRRALAMVARRFTMDEVVKQLESLYDSVRTAGCPEAGAR